MAITVNTNGELIDFATAIGKTIDTSKVYTIQICNVCSLKLTDFDEFDYNSRDFFTFDASQGQDLYIRTPNGTSCQVAIISAVSV